ncbi:cytochrome P450 6B5 [Manduca sexta]|uniref:unspecific monooxygenase n=1 Tax=Manduca sexta TaxID=7130 RepID=D5L0M6_MANSE|nr:cytochrome P450 6B5 [Manduca sexta]ADE05581.1 cytochrome P450 6AE32 [Manduca sexta]
MLPLFLILFLSSLLLIIYYVSKRQFGYWERKNVPYMKPAPVLGNYSGYILLKEYIGHSVDKIYRKFPNAPYVGAFYGTEPTLIVRDPELIKIVMTKDFYYFSSREIAKYCHKEVITQNLFFTFGDRWKVMRQNLTPLFSSGKMKNMFHLIEKCSRVFEKVLDNETAMSNVLESRSLLIRFTMDCIGSCAFGVDTNTLVNAEGNPFTTMGNEIFASTTSRGIKNITRAVWPFVFYGLGFKSFPPTIEQFFSKLLTGVFEARGYKPSQRNDFIDLILNLKKNNFIEGDAITNLKTGDADKVQLEVNNDLLVAQCIVFFAAGFETSATTSCLTLYELAKCPEAQKRVHEEVDSYMKRHGNKLDYSCVSELPYLLACIDETLRLYPVIGVLTREVVEDYTFPTDLTVEKGMRVHVPVFSLHRDPEYFPDPEEYRPERFYGEAKHNVKPYTYMPFGDGPRTCIGMRFAKMQMLAGLITLLKKFSVDLADDMPSAVGFEPKAIVTQPMGGIYLKFNKREGWEQRMLV